MIKKSQLKMDLLKGRTLDKYEPGRWAKQWTDTDQDM